MQVYVPKFNENGLLPVIVQDFDNREVIMFAWTNAEGLALTLKTDNMTFWTRSRKKLWVKGEESGNFLQVVKAYVDCDGDVLLVKVRVLGKGVVCHTGARHCFFRELVVGDFLSEPARPLEGKEVLDTEDVQVHPAFLPLEHP